MRLLARLEEPPACSLVGFEEVQQERSGFPGAGLIGMQAVGAHVPLRPNQSVELAGRVALRPQQERRSDLAPVGVEVQLGVALDLALYDPAVGETRFVGVRLGAAALGSRPAAEGAA